MSADPKAALTEEELAKLAKRYMELLMAALPQDAIRGCLTEMRSEAAHSIAIDNVLATARRCAELEAENGRLINDRDRFLRLLERALPELDRYEGCDHELESAIRKALEAKA